LDPALLDATVPILNLTGGSLTTTADAVTLANQSHLRTNPLSPTDLIAMNVGTLTVNNGSLVNVTGGSKLAVSGNFLTMSGGATLNIPNGLLLSVSGGSFARITGALVNFTGAGNVINLNNGLAVTGTIGGIPVFSSLGGTTGFTVTSATPIVGLGTAGTINVNGVACGASCAGAARPLLAIQGTGGTVRIGP
jgi:hypothetical protein